VGVYRRQWRRRPRARWVPSKAPAGGTDLTLTPGTPNVTWAGSTPAVLADITRVPGTPNVSWTGSTPTITTTGDLTLTPGVATVAWSGSAAPATADITRAPGTPNVAWTGSTPAVVVDKTLAPAVATVAWTGSTPSVILAGEVTLTPGAATVVWSGSTPTLTITPDAVPEQPGHGGDGGAGDLGDISTVETRSLKLRPGAATVLWTGSPAPVRVEFAPLRVRLPERAQIPPPRALLAPLAVPVVDLKLQPGAAAVAYAGSRARVVSVVPYADVLRLQARIEELERQHEEETAMMLTALSAD
jgi:hypothetical protein